MKGRQLRVTINDSIREIQLKPNNEKIYDYIKIIVRYNWKSDNEIKEVVDSILQ